MGGHRKLILAFQIKVYIADEFVEKIGDFYFFACCTKLVDISIKNPLQKVLNYVIIYMSYING